jgi:hypothetical protein
VVGRLLPDNPEARTFIEQCSGANPKDDSPEKRDTLLTRDTMGEWAGSAKFCIDLETLEVQSGKKFSVLSETVGGAVKEGTFTPCRTPEGVETFQKKGAKLDSPQMAKVIVDAVQAMLNIDVMKNTGSCKCVGMEVRLEMEDGSDKTVISIAELRAELAEHGIVSQWKKV